MCGFGHCRPLGRYMTTSCRVQVALAASRRQIGTSADHGGPDMSFAPGADPKAGDAYACDALANVVVPRTADLGDGFTVRRALPSARTRMVGPFIFFDHFGPTEFRGGKGLDVRPHPHIGLATVSYLFDGQIMHRDSLGTAVAIRPGEVNWMTAGRGIVHSERTPGSHRVDHEPIHGLQMWVALPAAKEEMDAGFAHHEVAEFPIVSDTGKNVRVVVGKRYGAASTAPSMSQATASRPANSSCSWPATALPSKPPPTRISSSSAARRWTGRRGCLFF